jgi:hypothetical protein
VSLFFPCTAETYTQGRLAGVSPETGDDKPGALYHRLLGPGTSIVLQLPLLQLLTVEVALLPLTEAPILMVLNMRSTSGDLHFGHFIFTPSSSFFIFRSSKTFPHFRQRNS